MCIRDRNSETPPEAWDVMMANHKHDVNYEDEEEADKQHQLSDDWLSKEELLNRRAAENKEIKIINSNKPQKIRREKDNTTPKSIPTTTESSTESVIESENPSPHLHHDDSSSQSDLHTAYRRQRQMCIRDRFISFFFVLITYIMFMISHHYVPSFWRCF